MRRLLLLGAILLLSGCLQPVKRTPLFRYSLNALPAAQHSAHWSGKTVVVTLPTASPGYQSDDMIYTTNNFQLSRYATHEWVAPPTLMLQSLLVETLANSAHYKAVLAPPFLGHVDLLLQTHIARLVQDFTTRPVQEQLLIQATLLSTATQKVLVSRKFMVAIPAAPNPYGGVVAANRAVKILLANIMQMCLQYS